MNQDLQHQIDAAINSILLKSYADASLNIFDEFMIFCQNYYEGGAHTLAEMRAKRNTKLKGDVFEYFSLRYFQHCYKVPLTQVWLLKDVPEEILEKLKLKRQDVGIDLIAMDAKEQYYAIQAKYRKKGYKASHGIPWSQLSTFYGLISRTGPFVKHIVITNANWVRHMGKKTPQDLSICYGTLSKIPADHWLAMSGAQGQRLDAPVKIVAPAPVVVPTIEEVVVDGVDTGTDGIDDTQVVQLPTDVDELRQRRLNYFTKHI